MNETARRGESQTCDGRNFVGVAWVRSSNPLARLENLLSIVHREGARPFRENLGFLPSVLDGAAEKHDRLPSLQGNHLPVLSPRLLCAFSKMKTAPFLPLQGFALPNPRQHLLTLCKNRKLLCKTQDAVEIASSENAKSRSHFHARFLRAQGNGSDDARGVERSREPIGRSRPRASPLFAEGTPKNRLPDP